MDGVTVCYWQQPPGPGRVPLFGGFVAMQALGVTRLRPG